MNTNYDNIAEGDHQKILQDLVKKEGEASAVLLIKSNMDKILEHYIGCTWGACYNTKFKELIQPHFDDVKLLDKILRSDLIKERANVIVGKTGARIFDSLLFELRQCKSDKIRNYLYDEFSG